MVEFECTLKQARTKRRITQQQLSDSTGIAITKISAYENDKRTMSLHTLFRIADAIGCGIEEIYRQKDTGIESLFRKRTPRKSGK